MSLQKVESILEGSTIDLTEQDRRQLKRQCEAFRTVLEDAPKSRRWKLRARIGDRVRWYTEVDERA